MEIPLRSALLGWLRAGPAPLDTLNAVEEESPVRASPPWLGIAASASADWSTKTRSGREIRIAFELATRGSEPGSGGALARAIQARIEALPRAQNGFAIATIHFLRARTERRPRNLRGTLIEYRFRILES